mmetsp:Transcript_3431/g.5170  ORF Transcript_3431/g.5170 Transcript_3431/m.5170 type:complete len:84 (+) Transcript_3431:84-335(+)
MKRERKMVSLFFQGNKLYDCKRYLFTIMDTYRKVSQYNRLLEMVVISDYSGTEKKALVLHAQKLVTDMGAVFTLGKIDRFRQM